jgi:catechol 2,3-dioxygenase-like lactoylglutathione lyase family enzyme
MLDTKEAIATVAVKDLDAAQRFYEDKVGLKLAPEQQEGAASYKAGKGTLFVYPSQYAGTNQATAVTWNVGADLDNIVKKLKSKGVVFEHYDMPDTTREGDIHVAGNMRIAWFKDPDGNIHALANG